MLYVGLFIVFRMYMYR